MGEFAALGGLVTGFGAASKLTKALIDLKVTGEVQDKVIELQTIIMTAQSSALAAQQDQFALISRVRELEEEIARLKSIGGEKEKYELVDVDRGALAYAPKKYGEGSEAYHWLCVECFDNGHKSVLQHLGVSQHNGKNRSEATFACNRCKSKIVISDRKRPGGTAGIGR